jgi:hypothetical protein
VLSLAQAVWQYGPGLAQALVDAAARTPPGAMALLDLTGNGAASSR